MSVSAADHPVVPEDGEVLDTAEVAGPDVTEGAPEVAPAAAGAETTFADLGLPEAVVRKLSQNGVVTPFPIQAATIPDALAGQDILGRGRTGSGKTLSFGLPLLTQLAGGYTEKKRPRGLILTPTRELAMQVSDALQPYGDVLGLKLKVVCGGTSMGNQIGALERGVDILVATPGRLRDLIDRGAAALDKVQIAVLDEADQMSDMGFLPEVTEILDLVPPGGQRMLFSATLENEVDTLVKRYLSNPVTHEVDAAQGAVTTMSHHVLVVKPKDKAPVTAAIAAREGRTILFVRTQLGADRVAEQLQDAGVRADALHGGMTQGARTRTLADFKDGYVNVLVATDVAARGIHVDDIDLVLNVDPAGDHKDYLHRSGRTARAGRSGTVVSLALPHQRRQIFRLMEDAGVDASRHIVGGGGAFDDDVARITGARSLTEVQAESAANAAQQAEREADDLARRLESAQRRASELRTEADRLLVRAARERGEALPERDAAPAAQAAGVPEPESAGAPSAAAGPDAAAAEGAVGAPESAGAPQESADSAAGPAGSRAASGPAAAPAAEGTAGQTEGARGDGRGDRPYGRDRGDDRPYGRDRRDDRPYNRDRGDRGDRPSGRDRRDDRGFGGGRDRRDDRPYGRDRRDERPYGRDRRDDRGGYPRRDDDRGDRPYGRDRREDRGGYGRRDDRGGYPRRDDRGDRSYNRDRGERGDRSFNGERGDRPFSRNRRDGDRGGYGGGRSFERRDHGGRSRDHGGRSFERREHNHRGGDRPTGRDRRDDRPARRDDHRRDDHRGNAAGRPFDRRADKPRWKRNG